MTILLGITGICLFRFGLLTAVDSERRVSFVSPNLAGCGAAVFLAVLCAEVIR